MALLARKGANGEVDIFHTVSRNITERKRVEDALRESESRFRSLSAASPLGIFQTDATGRCTYTNERWREISGQSLEESLGFGWNQVLHPEDRERVLREWQECASQREEVFLEYRILDARKESRWISARVKPMLAADGAITGWVGTVEDITERKRSEEDRMKFFALVENSSEYISMADREGKVFYLNPAGRRMAGIAEDADLASINWRRLYDDKNWKHRCEVAIPTLTATGRWDGEIRMRNLQTEQLLDLRVQGFRVLDPRSGKALCMATVQRDITASKRAEEDREKFVALLENSGDFIGMASLEGKPFYLNRAGRDLVGLGREIDVSTTTICEYYNDETAALVQNTGIPATFATGGWAAEANLRHFATHALIPVHMHTILVKDSKTGQPICLATVARDITDMKEAEKKLEKAHRGLRDMSRLSGMAEIATNVLHNVGNVLNSVNVSADQILEKVNRLRPVSLEKVAALLREHAHDLPDFLARDPQGKALPGYLSALFDQLADPHKDILPEVASLRKNVEHIREIVRMQQNCASVTGVLETIALTDLVEDAIRLDAASLTRHGVRVIREFSPVPSFPIEKHKVLQILVNLLKNAKQALDAAGGPDAQLTLRVGMNGGGTVKVSVIDNGVGIEPENLTRIFEHGFTTRKGGHGFGLHSGALAAQEMGGSLTAHSDGPGKGAELVLELPCGPAEKNL